jgi:hypothetical protein
MQCHLSGRGVQDLQAGAAGSKVCASRHLHKTRTSSSLDSYFLEKQGQACIAYQDENRYHTALNVPPPICSNLSIKLLQVLLLNSCCCAVAGSSERLLSCCYSSAAAINPPTSGAAMSLYGRLYCTDRAFASACTQRQAARTQQQSQKHCGSH